MTERELDALVAERNERGLCGCGCGGDIPGPKEGKPRRTKFLPDHRKRMYRKRIDVVAAERGLETRLSLAVLREGTGTKVRTGDAQSSRLPPEAPKRRKRSPGGVQVSAGPILGSVSAGIVAEFDTDPSLADRLAREWLLGALPERQRARLTEGT